MRRSELHPSSVALLDFASERVYFRARGEIRNYDTKEFQYKLKASCLRAHFTFEFKRSRPRAPPNQRQDCRV